jgi:hypothetical protein
VLAMTTAAAAGQRFLCLGDGLTMRDLALAAAPVFKPLGYNIPTGMCYMHTTPNIDASALLSFATSIV